MDVLGAEYDNYWETKMFFEELDSWGLDEALSSYHSSSSTEFPTSSSSPPAANSVVIQRNGRRKLDEKLYALRSVVPNITKMDKASIVKDAIDYIQELHEEEKRMTAEIAELEAQKVDRSPVSEITVDDYLVIDKGSRKRSRSSLFASESAGKSSIEGMELRVSKVGETKLAMSITCNKKQDTLIKICDIFNPLELNLISANITYGCGTLLHTAVVEGSHCTKLLKLAKNVSINN